MIDSVNHVEINGVKYKLAEDAGGQHYDKFYEPLRSPLAQQVVGDETPKFSTREDLLVWRITDWSGGEGQRKFDPQQPNRHYQLENVDPFSEPGKVFLGPDWELTQYQTAVDFNAELTLTKALGQLMGSAPTTARTLLGDAYIWDTATNPDEWEFLENTDASQGRRADWGTACGDEDNFYYMEDITDEIYRYDGSSWTLHNNQTSATGTKSMVALNGQLYIYDLANAKVFEVSGTTANTSSAETAILDLSTKGGGATINEGVGQIFVSQNRVYVLQVLSDETVLWEIVPSTAAGTGYGNDVARWEGLRAETGWSHMGTVFVVGTDNGKATPTRAIMYWQPDGSYGSLGWIRKEKGVTPASFSAVAEESSTLLTTGFMLGAHNGSSNLSTSRCSLWIIDAVSGGFCQYTSLGNVDLFGSGEWRPRSLVEWQGEWFVSGDDSGGSNENVFRTVQGTYNDGVTGAVVSPSYDMGIVDEKILERILIEYESLPSNTSFSVDYRLDGGSWLSAGTASTDGTTSAEFIISTDSTTRSFHSLQIRVELTTGSNAVTPTLTNIEVHASVALVVPRWRLMLDLGDDHSAGRQSFRGINKIDNLQALVDTEAVVDFKDGYIDRRPQFYDQTDVRVDAARTLLTKPGEGIAFVDLVQIKDATLSQFRGTVE